MDQQSFGPQRLQLGPSEQNDNTKTVSLYGIIYTYVWPSYTVRKSFRIILVYPVSLFLNRIYDKTPW